MEYITRKPHYPGALSDEAAVLLREIYDAVIWIPCWRDMTAAQIAGFNELYPGFYVERGAWEGYRVKGRDNLAAIREYQRERNAALHKLYAGVADPMVAKWEARAAIKLFRMSPWLPTARVREAHKLHWQDCMDSLDELRRAG